ncbi:hypothetical protein MRX96_026199 [Rhipicephalus microplus]
MSLAETTGTKAPRDVLVTDRSDSNKVPTQQRFPVRKHTTRLPVHAVPPTQLGAHREYPRALRGIRVYRERAHVCCRLLQRSNPQSKLAPIYQANGNLHG